MTTLEIVLIAILWVILAAFNVSKQIKHEGHSPKESGEIWVYILFACILAPVWLLGAIINQVIIKDWK